MLLSNYIITRAKFPILSNLVLKFEKKIKIIGEEKEKLKWIKKREENLLLWRGIVDFTNLLFWEELDAVFLLIDKVQNSPLKYRWTDLRFS